MRVFRRVRNEVPRRLKPTLTESAQRGPEGPHYPSGIQHFSVPRRLKSARRDTNRAPIRRTSSAPLQSGAHLLPSLLEVISSNSPHFPHVSIEFKLRCTLAPST